MASTNRQETLFKHYQPLHHLAVQSGLGTVNVGSDGAAKRLHSSDTMTFTLVGVIILCPGLGYALMNFFLSTPLSLGTTFRV